MGTTLEYDKFRFLAEFTWAPKGDVHARDRFRQWKKLLPSTGLDPKETQGYYLTGTRTFWIIGYATEVQVIALCKKIQEGTEIGATWYHALEPDEIDCKRFENGFGQK